MQDLIIDIIVMGTCIFITGYILHLMAYRKGWEDVDDDDDFDIEKELDLDVEAELEEDLAQFDHDKVKSKYSRGDGNTFLDKWMDFGGGYYGTVAFVELVFIELGQFKNFIVNFPGVSTFVDSLGIDFLVAFFVEQMMNFVAAIIWPTDYIAKFSILHVAIFIGVTWLLYEQARKFALRQVRSELS